MKIQFGSALSDEAKSNTFITIPGLRGMASKEISVKNLAGIIQARMSEILDFVSFHLKQVGLDNRMLNGGIILTGGGSQLKHVLQLTEYVTGLNARIGLPNEHLTAGAYSEELSKPMYSTCIGLILKGYNDFENRNRQMSPEFIEINPADLAADLPVVDEVPLTPEVPVSTESPEAVGVATGMRSRLTNFMNTFKTNLIDIFKEEEDTKF
jgi:cell division protein FtsA